jgi:hypothetical protein
MRIVLFYQIQIPKPCTTQSETQRYWEMLEQVEYAEEMGFESVWFVEHHFLTEWAHCSASEVMLAAISQHTTTMRLGFGVILFATAVAAGACRYRGHHWERGAGPAGAQAERGCSRPKACRAT